MKFLERIKYKIQQRKIDRQAKELALELYQLIDFYVVNDRFNNQNYRTSFKNNEVIQALLEEMYEVLEGKYEREQ
nr:MAG TPA: hypothetical protein [Bacteriophage sp.]